MIEFVCNTLIKIVKRSDQFMADIKPIETFYNGYRFRSRLEARWAVFFDAAGIKYEYEPEGYEVDGIKYLPDFYLPELDVHVEVKPDRDGIEKDIIRCSKMIKWGGAIKAILFLGNIPTLDTENGGHWHFPILYWKYDDVFPGWWYFEDECDDDGNSVRVIGTVPYRANYPSPFYICEDDKIVGRLDNVSLSAVTDCELRNKKTPKDFLDFNIDFLLTRDELFYAALRKARQARFEHGECG